jgi:hypothetical protein
MDAIEVNTSARASNHLWRAAFLCVFAETGNATKAAEAAGIDASTAYRARQTDADFKLDWENAKLVAADTLRAEAWRRAVEGGRSYKFTKTGEAILHPETGQPYYEMVYSDALLTLLLKAYAPDEFKDRSAVESTIKQAPVYDLSRLTAAQLDQLEQLTRAATPTPLP